MRILISCVGTRGDVQPALALAIALRDLGQTVRICAPPNFTGWASERGFEAFPIGVEMRAPRPGETPAPLPDLIANQFEVVEAAADGCDLIVGAGAHQYAVRSIAALRGIPCEVAVYAPTSIPSPGFSPQTRAAWNERSLERVNANRVGRGLERVGDVVGHILGERAWLAADPLLGPAPVSAEVDVVQTGAWLMADSRPLPAELEAFLEAGAPPVYLGFGSMPAPAGLAATLIAATRAVGRRAVLSKGWADLGLIDSAPDCIAVEDVSHAALFPRLAAVVHHGGAGTTTAAALSGAPQVLAPMFADQFYWAQRIAGLGLGATATSPITVEALVAGLTQALDPAVRRTCAVAANRIVPDGAALAARRLVEAFG
jgi:vancomycin aglycone glucosyltransferase